MTELERLRVIEKAAWALVNMFAEFVDERTHLENVKLLNEALLIKTEGQDAGDVPF